LIKYLCLKVIEPNKEIRPCVSFSVTLVAVRLATVQLSGRNSLRDIVESMSPQVHRL